MNNIPVFSLVFFLSANVFAAKAALKDIKSTSLPPITGFRAVDMPYDAGGAALLTWDPSPADAPDAVYRVYVSTSESGGWLKADEFPADTKLSSGLELPFWAWKRSDKEHALKIETANFFKEPSDSIAYFFKASLVKGAVSSDDVVASTKVASNWFRLDRINNLALLVTLISVFFLAVSRARKKGLFIRRIAGLDAIDEAIGRATEMGKPIYYIPGIGQLGGHASGISTITSTFILGDIAKKVAQYDSSMKVPHYDPIVMTVAKEIVKQAYLETGRPDSYRDDMNFFVSSDQFSYAASVDGMIDREKPAACFFMGYFMAESLLFAEVGAASGAIQIAGTDVEHQLPFFFTACDYTLIGEEFYAAGAYLSRDPMLLSALKVQDFGKLIVMLSIALGTVFAAAGMCFGWPGLIGALTDIFRAY